MPKRKIGEVLWAALECAKRDRQSLVDAYHGDQAEEAVRDAMADVRAFEAVQKRLFGTTRTELQAKIDRMRPVSIFRMLQDDFDPDDPFR